MKLAYLCFQSELTSSHTSQSITSISAHVILKTFHKTIKSHDVSLSCNILAFPELRPHIQIKSLSSPALFENYANTTFITDGGNMRFIIGNLLCSSFMVSCHSLFCQYLLYRFCKLLPWVMHFLDVRWLHHCARLYGCFPQIHVFKRVVISIGNESYTYLAMSYMPLCCKIGVENIVFFFSLICNRSSGPSSSESF